MRRAVRVDYHHNIAFVPVVGQGGDERIIGVAAILSQLLFAYARIEGIRTLYAKILVSNQHMIEFARWLGMSIHSVPGPHGCQGIRDL